MRIPMQHLLRTLTVCLTLVPAGLSSQPGSGQDSPLLKSILFREAPVHYVAWLIGESWGRHIVVNEGARDKQVDIFLDNITCLNALKAVCHANGLWYQEDPESGIIYVETLEDYIGGSRLQDQKQVEVLTVVYPRAEDVAASLQEVFQDMVVYVEPEDENGDETEQIGRALQRMSQLARLSTIVDEADLNLQGGGFATGGGSRAGRDGIEATSRFQDELEDLESRPNQVETDVSGEPTRLNPGLVYIAAVRQSNTLLLRSSDPEAIKQIKAVVADLDRPRAQVLLEVKVLALDVTDEKQRAIDILFNQENLEASAGFAEGLTEFPFNPDGTINPFFFGPLGTLEGGFDPRSVVFQVVGEEAQARLQLLDDQGKVQRLATPNLMVADLEASRLFVGDETTILTEVEVTSDTTTGDNPLLTVTRNPTTERRDIGTTLVITPKIHADNTVTIRIMQENAREGETKTIVFGSTADGDFFESTDIEKQTITSTVVAKSGELVALGGLVQRSKLKNVEQVPVLGDVPVIGALFERKQTREVEEELIVLIRPFVMLTPDSAERLSQGFLNRNATHEATRDGSLEMGLGNPTRLENNRAHSQILHERIGVKNTPLDFLGTP